MNRAAVAVIVIAALAACSSAKQDPKAGFVKAAAKVCDESAHSIEVASAQLTAQSSEEQVARFLKETLVPLYRQRLTALVAIAAPEGDRATITALLADQRKVVDAIEADPTTFTNLATDPFAAVDARWDAYGVTPCGSRSALPSSS